MATISGTSGNDTLNGTSVADTINGLAGNDWLNGGDGNDVVIGGAGADTLDGGNGYDWASYAGASTGLVIDLYDGSRSTGDAIGDVCLNIESYVGTSFNDTFFAGGTGTTFDGGAVGADDVVNYSLATAGITITLNYTNSIVQGAASGGAGIADGDYLFNIDRVIGTTFDDVYVLDANSATRFTVTEAASGGTDEVRTSGALYTIGANIENLTFTGTAASSGTGNTLANVLGGSTGNDVLYGLAGNDTLNGNDGNDVLYGGAGADVLNGGNGYDSASYSNSTSGLAIDLNNGTLSTGDAAGDSYNGIESYVGSTFNDTFIAGATATTFDGGPGGADDVVNYSGATAGITLTINYVNSAYQGPAAGGGGIADGDNFWNIDRVIGTNYGDVYTLDVTAAANFKITEAVGGGTDEVRTVAASYTLGANIENLTYTGAAAFAGTGNSADNILTGGSGADTLYGAAGGDTLAGNDGNDVLVGGAGGDTLNGGNGIDAASYIDSAAAITFNLATGVFSGDASGDLFNSVEKIIGTGFGDTFVASNAADTLDGGNGTDVIDYSASASAVSVNLSTGIASGGDAAGDALIGIEKVIGTAYADTLSSSTSGHILVGGLGDDSYVVGSAGVSITENSGGGADGVQTALASLSIAGYANVETLTYTGAGAFAGTGNSGDNIITGGTGNDTLIGGAGADTLSGGTGIDTAGYTSSASAVNFNFKTGVLSGDAVGDVFNGIEKFLGSNYNDTFVAGAGADSLDGAGGTDLIDYSGSSAAVNVDLTTGAASGGDATGDAVTNFEKVIGTNLADTLASSTSGHTLVGALGDDIYLVGNLGVVITENAGEGTDVIQTTLAYATIGANVENLTYTGSGSFEGDGNGGANVITGGTGADTLAGNGGADTLNGGAGTDTATYIYGSALTLNFKTGVSTGDAAGDVYNSIEKFQGSVFGDTFVAGSGADNVDGYSGFDIVDYSSSSAAVNVNLTAGTGSGGDAAGDILANIEKVIGTTFGDTLASSTSGNMLVGGVGDDIYTVGNSGVAITENSGEGSDEVRTSLASLSIAGYANVENLTYTGAVAFTGTGGSLDNVITGAAGADTLYGGVGNDSLNGGDGNDALIGGAGADVLNGGNGTDAASYADSSAAITFNLKAGVLSGGDAAGDVYNSIEKFTGTAYNDTFISGLAADNMDGGSGTDVVDYSGSSAAVSVLMSGGTSSGGDAAGDTLSNIEKVVGTAFADTLSSSTSGHTLIGGSGDDTYVVGNSGVVVTENSGEGTDEIQTSLISLSLAAYSNIENLTYTGAAAFSGTGTTLDNMISGGSANDTLFGGAGNDVLNGNNGNDVLVGGAGTDTLAGGAGTDIASYVDAGAGIVFDPSNSSFSGDASGDAFFAIEGFRGTEFSDTFYAGAGSYSFDGGAGADTVSYAHSGAGITLNLTTNTGTGDAAGDSYSNVETLIGTAFADNFTGGSANETFIGAAGDTINGGAGTDTLSYAASAAAVSLNLATGIGTGDAAGTAVLNVEVFIGTAYDDSFTGGAANETFIAGTGADTIDGGSGIDIASYADSAAGVTVDLSAGSATGGTAAGDILSHIENLYGSSYGDTLTGDASANLIEGGGGNDLLHGGAGNDVIHGEWASSGGSTDTAFGDDGNDTIDLSLSSVGYAYGGNGSDTITVGLNATNRAYGGADDDTITVMNGVGYGEDGNDHLTSYSDGAIVDGGAGDDVLRVNFNGYMLGGDGTDEYSYDSATTSVAFIKDDGTSGTDTVFVSWASTAIRSVYQVGNDAYLMSGGQTVVLLDWYAGYSTIENFVTTDHQIFHI